MAKIRGKILQGLGKSQDTIKEQLPFFRECFPEVIGCRPGTINILLEKPLVIITPDFTTEPVPWHPAFKVVKGGEIFRFLRIRLELNGQGSVNAWVYKAQFSPYRDNPFYLEVLAPPINLTSSECQIEVLSTCHEGVIVIGAADRSSSARSES